MSNSIKSFKKNWQEYNDKNQDFSFNLNVELFEKDGEFYIYIGEFSSSGYEKKISSIDDVGEVLKDYLDNFYN